MKNWETCGLHHSAFILLHLFRLFEIAAAINDAGVEQGRGLLTRFGGRSSTTPQLLCGLF